MRESQLSQGRDGCISFRNCLLGQPEFFTPRTRLAIKGKPDAGALPEAGPPSLGAGFVWLTEALDLTTLAGRRATAAPLARSPSGCSRADAGLADLFPPPFVEEIENRFHRRYANHKMIVRILDVAEVLQFLLRDFRKAAAQLGRR